MTLLTVVQDVCLAVGVTQPTSVFSGLTSNRTMQEMLALANEMAQRTAYNTREWSKLKRAGSIFSSGNQDDYPLPADFKRFLLDSNMWKKGFANTPMRFISSLDEYLQRQMIGTVAPNGEWLFTGDRVSFRPRLAPADVVSFVYLSKDCIQHTSGQSDTFTADTDTYLLPERLLKLGMIWQWKAQKGSPYAEDMGTFTDALMIEMGSDKPAPILVGRLPMSTSAKVAYSGVVPMP